MKKEEALLAEHRELVELYTHDWTTIFYVGVSYVICNGALCSLLGVLFAIRSIIVPLLWGTMAVIVLIIAITAYIVFIIISKRTQMALVSLVNRAIAIEETLQKESLPLDTFGGCIAIIEKGRFLVDSKGTYAEIRLWHKLSIFRGMYLMASVIVITWIVITVVMLSVGSISV